MSADDQSRVGKQQTTSSTVGPDGHLSGRRDSEDGEVQSEVERWPTMSDPREGIFAHGDSL